MPTLDPGTFYFQQQASEQQASENRPGRSERFDRIIVHIKVKQALRAFKAYVIADACQSLLRRADIDLKALEARVARKRAELHGLRMRGLLGCPLCGTICTCGGEHASR